MSKRGEARIKFEKAWHQLCKVLGHRHPRSVAVWKNLDKARRSQATVGNKQDLVESVKMRTDAGYLIPGDFKVNAVLSEEAMAAGKKKKASKGKGKKK